MPPTPPPDTSSGPGFRPPSPPPAAPRRIDGLRFSTAAALAILPIVAYLLAMNGLHPGPAGDEKIHLAAIRQFASGDWSNPDLAMFPAYHAVLAFPARILGARPGWIRATGILEALVILASVAWAAQRTRRPGRGHALFQVLWLPMFFPFIPLVYTDPASATWVLLALALQLSRRYKPAAASLLVSCLIRQSNALWVVFFVLWAFHDAFRQPQGFRFGPRPPRPPFRGFGLLLRGAWARGWAHMAVLAAFAAIVLAVGEVVPRSQSIVGPRFNPAQIFAFGIGAGVVWLPIWADEWRGGFGELRAWPRGRLAIVLAAAASLVVVLALCYRNPNPRNQSLYYLRNRPLVMLQAHAAARYAASAFMILTAAAAIRLTRRHPDPWLLAALWLWGLAFMSIHSTVDPRYAIIPFSLLAFFVVPPRGKEPLHAVWLLGWALIMAAGTAAGLWIP